MKGTRLTLDKLRLAMRALESQPRIRWFAGIEVGTDGKVVHYLINEQGEKRAWDPFAPLPVK